MREGNIPTLDEGVSRQSFLQNSLTEISPWLGGVFFFFLFLLLPCFTSMCNPLDYDGPRGWLVVMCKMDSTGG